MDKQKKALVTGLSGQDGSYLAEFLLDKGYKVYGTLRRHSVSEAQDLRVRNVKGIESFYADLNDKGSLIKIFRSIQPDEIYHTAAMSHVRVSFDIPEYTLQTNIIGTFNVLEAMRQECPNSRLYFCGSSEQFGNCVDQDGFQRETTPMFPVSPYGVSKLAGFHLCLNYRRAYNLFISTGRLFNHESPRRGSNFVTAKIVKGAVEIKQGLRKNLELGNLKAKRDWGHSKDYVKAIWMILNHHQSDDFVVATGQTYSIEEFCKLTFEKLGMNYKDYIIYNNHFTRPEELNYLRGDATKARNILGWKPEISFDELVDDMIQYWDEKVKSGCII